MEKIKIKAIRKIQKRDKYDLEVEKNHNFFANGILVHNCRLLTLIDYSGKVECYSRQGKKFETVDHLINEIKKLNFKGIVLDGEICSVDKNGKEDFQSIIKEIRKKDHQIINYKYKIFDCINYNDFFNKSSNVILSQRFKQLQSLNIKSNYLDILEQELIKSEEHLQEWILKAEQNGWEGLIIRKNVTYEGKRSNDMLKIKKMHDAEYKVKDIEIGPIRIIDKETGLEKTIQAMTAAIIEHKGNKVNVGSGWNQEERVKYFNNPKELIGKVITVKYFEETKNQDGNYSLRFPIVKCIYGSERVI